jgi:hypothetical protein
MMPLNTCDLSCAPCLNGLCEYCLSEMATISSFINIVKLYYKTTHLVNVLVAYLVN